MGVEGRKEDGRGGGKGSMNREKDNSTCDLVDLNNYSYLAVSNEFDCWILCDMEHTRTEHLCQGTNMHIHYIH